MPSAKIQPLTIVAPGQWGLNKQQSQNLLHPNWCTNALNAVFGDNGLLSARNGWATLNNTPITGAPSIIQVAEWKSPTSIANNLIVSATPTKLFSGTTTLTDVTGSLTIANGNWAFANFNSILYGLNGLNSGAANQFVQYTGSGNFTSVTVAHGTAPTGTILISAFGRLWGVNSDNQTIQYSALLDATNWDPTQPGGAGSLNMQDVWPNQTDSIVALAVFNSFLVVFGYNTVVIYQDGSGSNLGINPLNLEVADFVAGIGCVARDSVVNVQGEDLVFLGTSGVFSLKRLLQNRSNPLQDLSMHVRDYLKAAQGFETNTNIRATFNPRLGAYLLCLPTAGLFLAFDTKLPNQDGSWRVTEWNGIYPTALFTAQDGYNTYGGGVSNGTLMNYGILGATQSQIYTDLGATYTFIYASGWLDFGPEVAMYLKALKRGSIIVASNNPIQIQFQWGYDFKGLTFNYGFTLPASGGTWLWNVSNWGVDSFGFPFAVPSETNVPGQSYGQFLQVGMTAGITGNLAIQQFQLFVKLGRLI